MAEGIRFLEGATPRRGGGGPLRPCRRHCAVTRGEAMRRCCRRATILIAAGTQPNTVLAREEPEWAELDGRYFQALDEDGNPATPERSCKPASAHVLMSRHADGRAVSFFGDLHPSFAGNVVKAMAGAKRGYPVVSRALARLRPDASCRLMR